METGENVKRQRRDGGEKTTKIIAGNYEEDFKLHGMTSRRSAVGEDERSTDRRLPHRRSAERRPDWLADRRPQCQYEEMP